MGKEISQALRQIMDREGWTQAQLATRVGVQQATISRWLSGKQRPDHVHRLALNKMAPDLFPLGPALPTQGLEIRGAVQAGHFAEALQWPKNEWRVVPVPALPGRYTNAFALEVRGPSMNEFYEDGSLVVVVPYVDFADSIRSLEPGDHVVVQRVSRDGLFEASLKEIQQDRSGKLWLWPRSTDPEHQQPIPYPEQEADFDAAGAPEVAIIAVVIGGWNWKVL